MRPKRAMQDGLTGHGICAAFQSIKAHICFTIIKTLYISKEGSSINEILLLEYISHKKCFLIKITF